MDSSDLAEAVLVACNPTVKCRRGLLEGLPPGAAESFLAEHGELIPFTIRDDIPSRNGGEPEVKIVVKGAIGLVGTHDGGTSSQYGSIFRSGQAFGELSVVLDQDDLAHAVACLNTRLVAFRSQSFRLLCDEHPVLYRNLFIHVADKLAKDQRHLLKMAVTKRRVPAPIAALIPVLNLFGQHGVIDRRGFGVVRFFLPLQLWGALLRKEKKSMDRDLGDLRRYGLVDYEPKTGTMKILLRAFADPPKGEAQILEWVEKTVRAIEAGHVPTIEPLPVKKPRNPRR